MKRFLVLSLIALLLFGCVGPTVRTYVGHELARSEVAVLKGHYLFLWVVYGFRHTGYDIRVGPSEYKVGLSEYAGKVELLPGRHPVTIREFSETISPVGGSGSCRCYALEFNAEPGREYKIKKQGSLLTIVDTQSDGVVASTPDAFLFCP